MSAYRNRVLGAATSILGIMFLAACKTTPGGGGGGLPFADLFADSTSGVAPLTVSFDASGSDDPNGTIDQYEWDWDSDGTFDDQTVNPRVSHIYPAAGTFTARLRVTDDDGNLASDTLTIRVLSGSWNLNELDSVGNVGAYTSAAIIDGRPAIAYMDLTDQRLKYVIASTGSGLSWPVPLTVVPGSRSGLQASLAEIDGRPAIAYINDLTGQVEYARALDIDGDSWDDPTEIGIPSTITDVVLLEADGFPAVVFLDTGTASDGEAVFIRADDAFGTFWGNGLLVDDVGEDVSALDAAIVNGVPAVVYVEEDTRDLRFVQARDQRGDSWFLPVDAVDAGTVGDMVSLAVIGGLPSVSFMETSGGDADLYFVQAQDADGVQWDAGVPVDVSAQSSGQHNSLSLIGGRPAISFYNLTNERLEYVEATDVDGDNWTSPLVVDSGGSVGQFNSLVSVQGSPGISYYDAGSGELKWAVLE